MVIEGDPYYLQKFRSIHNHDLDTNLIENQNLIAERDVHRPGAQSMLPQSMLAIQEHCGIRRREINDEKMSMNNQATHKSISYEDCVKMHEKMKTQGTAS